MATAAIAFDDLLNLYAEAVGRGVVQVDEVADEIRQGIGSA
jgi:hypothetical protein